jgi:O-succinylbenzoate synthase
MRIERLQLCHVQVPYVRPFETSLGRETSKDCILVRAWADGLTGWGESPVAAAPFYMEETVETAWPILAGFLAPRVLGRTFEHPDEVGDWLRPIRRNYLAKVGLEAAAWDIYAQSRRLPLARVLGGTRPRVAVGMSVGIEPTIDATLDHIDEWLTRGYQRIKVKIKPGLDVALIRAIRDRFGAIPLQADANAAYTLADAPRLALLDAFDLVMLEQPLDYDDLADHAALSRSLRTPICLDESIHSAGDARKALDLGACRIINVKAARMGGLGEARRCHALCLDRGSPLWCGGLLETGIGRAANIALASLPGFTLPADLGASDRYFHEDIIEPHVVVNADGTVDVPGGPGLGFRVVERLVDKYTVRRETLRAPAGVSAESP